MLFTSDNGVNLAQWPDAGTPAYRGEKGTTWDGGVRVSMFVRWPGRIAANQWSGEFMTSEDWLPTLMAAAGEPGIQERLLKGERIGERDYRVLLDGHDQTAMLTGQGQSQRREFFYYAETELNAVRVDHWKLHFTLKNSWLGAPEKLDGGLLFDIKIDPFERTSDTGGHLLWMKEKTWLLPILAGPMRRFGQSLKDFPPRQKGGGLGAAALLGG